MTFQLSAQARALLVRFYLGGKVPEERADEAFAELLRRVSETFSGGRPELAEKLTRYARAGWFSYSSPILSNWEGRDRGMPISCFLMYVPDTIEGLVEHTAELRWLSVSGGGCGGHWSHVRPASTKSCGTIPFLHTVDADMTAYRQGDTRKGSYAAYMDVSHPDVVEFIGMRVPTGGDVNRKNLNLHHGVNVTDAFVRAAEADGPWDLVCPHTGAVTETLRARQLWERLLETRYRIGEPYLNFIDAARRGLCPALRARGLEIHGSNLCNEIHLPTAPGRTAVCCLASLNLERVDEWWDTDLVECCVEMLDNVLQVFIDRGRRKPYLAAAVRSAEGERSLGLGTMGWAYYLQRRGLPFDSAEAAREADCVFGAVKARALAASRRLALERGEPPDLRGYGLRNAHLLAVAPNANTASLLGTSPGVDPQAANAYVHRTRAGSHLVVNPLLRRLLAARGRDDPETWRAVTADGGSVRHLDCLTDAEKAVFKTAVEVCQLRLVEQAAVRQRHICQGQSLNLFFPAGVDRGLLNRVHLAAWKAGCKGLYYLRTHALTAKDLAPGGGPSAFPPEPVSAPAGGDRGRRSESPPFSAEPGARLPTAARKKEDEAAAAACARYETCVACQG